ncbi:MAG: alpha/beta hydrolase [Ilumatobacteraceae bacterium]
MTDHVGDVAVHRFGGTGPPLLISHATGFHGWCYEPMARGLAHQFGTVALDYRGHGDTPAPPDGSAAWSGFGDDAEAVAVALSQEPGATGGLFGFGHSLGGAGLVMAASRRPGLFRRLVLFEPIISPPGIGLPDDVDPDSTPLVAAARRRRATFGSLDEAFANNANKPPLASFDPDALWAYVSHGFAVDGDEVRLKCDPEYEAETFRRAFDARVWDLLASLEIPVTVIAGTKQPGENPTVMAPRVAEALPHGSYVARPDLDHFGPMTRPDVVADLVREACQPDLR